MAKNKKKYDDDDGRTIADMSDISRTPILVPQLDKLSGRNEENNENEEKTENEFKIEMTGDERRAYIGGALGAALAIGSVFAVAGFIFIFIMTRLH